MFLRNRKTAFQLKIRSKLLKVTPIARLAPTNRRCFTDRFQNLFAIFSANNQRSLTFFVQSLKILSAF